MKVEGSIEKLVSHLFRQEAGKMTAILIRLFGFSMLSLAEDIVQDTFVTAYSAWKQGKVPGNPPAWLMQVAKNKALNMLKREARNISIPHSAFVTDEEYAIKQHVDQAFADNDTLDAQLKLLLLCCHPGLNDKQQIILTLQILCAFSLEEIAAAMLMKKEAIKKILFRTKQQIKRDGLFADSGYLLQSMQRLDMVRNVLYLMFNEGYKTTEANDLINKDLCFEAIRLGKIVLSLGDNEAIYETKALLSLMFFNVARFTSRISHDGHIVPLEEQDRSQWNKALISEAYRYLEESRNAAKISKYHLEAGIAALHCSANAYDSTNWEQVLFYYDELIKSDSSPIIALNRSVAIYHVFGAETALTELMKITDAKLDNYYLFHATKGTFLEKLRQYEPAISAYKQAIQYTNSSLNIGFLLSKIEHCNHIAN